MIRGIIASARALVVQARRQDLFSANLANAGTVGYKRLRAAVTSQSAGVGASRSRGWGVPVTVVGAAPDLSGGPIRRTGNPLDLAILGMGFFVIQTPRGIRYTRAGAFSIDSNRRLVTQQGDLVLGEKGPLTLPPGRVQVGEDGTVSVNGQPVDRLRLVAFGAGTALTPEGEHYFIASGTGAPTRKVRVVQGALEDSNVRPPAELSRMMMGLRVYEANAMALKTQDETVGQLIAALRR